MSYDIYLADPVTGETLMVANAHHIRGGTYRVRGTDELHLNITYNYAPQFRKVLGEEGIRSIYGQTGAESIPTLFEAINALDVDVTDNYWDSTEGNARRALCGLLAFAHLRPDGVWRGD